MTTALQNWRDIKRGTGVNLLGLLARSFRGIYLIVVARLFGAEVLGLFLLSWGVVDVVSKLGLFGLDRGLVRFLPRHDAPAGAEERERLVSSALAVVLPASLCTALALYVLADPVASVLLKQTAAIRPLQILAWAIVPDSLCAVLLAVMRVERRMQYEVWIRSLVEPASLLVVAIALSMTPWGALGLYIAQLAAFVISLLASIVVLARLRLVPVGRVLAQALRSATTIREPYVGRLRSFSFPIALYDFIAMAVMSLDLFLLARFVGAREIGIYGAAVQIAALVKKSRQSVEPVLIPVLAQELQQGRPEGVRRSLDDVTRWIVATNVGFLLLVGVFGREILRLFGPEFGAAAGVLFLVALAHAINGSWGIVENVILLQRPRWNLWNWVVSAPLAVGLNLALIPRFGPLGAAASVVIVLLVLAAARLWQTHCLIGWNPLNKDVVLVVGVSLLLAAPVFALKVLGPDSRPYRVALAIAMLGSYVLALRRLASRGTIHLPVGGAPGGASPPAERSRTVSGEFRGKTRNGASLFMTFLV